MPAPKLDTCVAWASSRLDSPKSCVTCTSGQIDGAARRGVAHATPCPRLTASLTMTLPSARSALSRMLPGVRSAARSHEGQRSSFRSGWSALHGALIPTPHARTSVDDAQAVQVLQPRRHLVQQSQSGLLRAACSTAVHTRPGGEWPPIRAALSKDKGLGARTCHTAPGPPG